MVGVSIKKMFRKLLHTTKRILKRKNVKTCLLEDKINSSKPRVGMTNLKLIRFSNFNCSLSYFQKEGDIKIPIMSHAPTNTDDDNTCVN